MFFLGGGGGGGGGGWGTGNGRGEMSNHRAPAGCCLTHQQRSNRRPDLDCAGQAGNGVWCCAHAVRVVGELPLYRVAPVGVPVFLPGHLNAGIMRHSPTHTPHSTHAWRVIIARRPIHHVYVARDYCFSNFDVKSTREGRFLLVQRATDKKRRTIYAWRVRHEGSTPDTSPILDDAPRCAAPSPSPLP